MQNDQQNGQFYNPNQQQSQTDNYAPQPDMQQDNSDHEQMAEDSIRWTASEFVQHDKNISWYLILLFTTLAVAAIAYLVLNKDLFAPSIVLVLGLVFGIAGSRKPRILDYSMSEHGLTAGQKHFRYEDFKSYSLISDGPVSTVLLMPSKRFSPTLTLYVPESEIDEVLDALGMFLPIEDHEVGYVDKFLSKIRF